MKGYWGPRNLGCRCCHSGPKEKFWCQSCDHVAKAPVGWRPACPFCCQPMTGMGHRWRPGRKGRRGTPADLRHASQPVAINWRESVALGLLKRWGG
jgi:hypothetical protein